MAANVGRLNVVVSASAGGLVAGLTSAQRMVQSFAATTVGAVNGVTMAFGGLGAAGLGTWAVKLGADAEKTAAQFRVLIGDTGKAAALLADLKKFDLEAPLSLGAILDASKVLLQFGMDASQVSTTIRQLGDVSMGNADQFGRLALAMAQVTAAGKLQGQDLLQLVNAGWNPLQTIAATTGETLNQVRERMTNGAVSASEVAQALKTATSEGGRFAGMMATAAATTLGKWDILLGKLSVLGTTIGTATLPAASMLIDKMTSLVEALGSLDGQLVLNVAKLTAFGVAFGATLVYGPRIIAMIGGVVSALRSMATAQAIVTAITGPKGWLQLVASLAVAGGAVVAMDKLFQQSAGSADKAAAAANGAAAASTRAANAVASVGAATSQSAMAAAVSLDGLGKKWEDAASGLATYQDLLERGMQVTKEVRNPSEIFGDTIRELQSLLAAGTIDGETYSRAFAKASAELQDATKQSDALRQSIEGVGAAVAGTSQGFAAVAKARREALAARESDRAVAVAQRAANGAVGRLREMPAVKIGVDDAKVGRLETLAQRIERAQMGVGLGVARDRQQVRPTLQSVAPGPPKQATDPKLLEVLARSESHLSDIAEQQRRAKPVKLAQVELY